MVEIIHTLKALAEEYQTWLFVLGSISFAMLLVSLIVTPIIIGSIPADYFNNRKRPKNPAKGKTRFSFILIRILKNIAGILCILLGVLLLPLPGNGMLTILMGFLFLDYPGKYRLERRVVSIPVILNALNWMRRQAGKAEFEIGRLDD